MTSYNAAAPEWSIRIRLRRNGELLYGSGVSRLLYLAGQSGSLHAAAKEMSMSYRKALGIVKRTEAALGQPFLMRSIGGAGGGGSELTDFARAYVARFQAFQDQVEEYARGLAAADYRDLLTPFDEN